MTKNKRYMARAKKYLKKDIKFTTDIWGNIIETKPRKCKVCETDLDVSRYFYCRVCLKPGQESVAFEEKQLRK